MQSEASRPVPHAQVSIEHEPRSFTHQVLRLMLTIWLIAYPVVACAPVILGAAAGGSGGAITAVTAYLVGGLLFWPWLVGIIVLGLLAVLTR